jgi:LTXXQ motif family protein
MAVPHFAAPAMARPAGPAFHAPAMQGPGFMPHAAPHFAVPARQMPQRFAAPRSIQHPPMAQRVPSVASHPADRAMTRRTAAPSAKAIAQRQEHSVQRQEQSAQRQERSAQRQDRTVHRQQQRQERSVQREETRGQAPQQRQTTEQRQATDQRQVTEQRQREALSRQSSERQGRIDRLQQRVQQLQARRPQGRNAQRELQSQQRLLQREREAQQRDMAQQQKLGAQPSAQGPAAAAQAAARGRFAAQFRDNADPRSQATLAARLNGWAPRNAWRHHARANFVPWLGPVFWPYAYADIFEYTFWPDAYDDAYWAYAYDDFLDTVFWDVGSPYSAYASIASDDYLEPGSAMVGSSRLVDRAGLSQQALRQLCSHPDQGITAWPFADVARTIQPTAEQRDLLEQLKRAAAQASDVLKKSCSDQYPLTPPGRLQTMIDRISATLAAVRIVRPALEAFYSSLSDEQQARFNTLGPQLPTSAQTQGSQEANASPEARSESCGAPKTSLSELPIERIKSVVHPTGQQSEALDRLQAATDDAVRILQKACPDEVPVTPVGRLQAMQQRLSAMLEAANQVKPALDEFYASLGSEQKQRFNTLQQVAGR